jgi:hypothetical protein
MRNKALLMTRSWYYSDSSDLPDESSLGEDRGWYYDEDSPLDFDDLYLHCNGTILYRSDCGSQACGTAACCHSTGPDSFIFFLPGELEFHRQLKPGIPFQQVAPEFVDRLHCNGNAGCIYDKRPLDCRSYPYFPAVVDGQHVGYFDCRGSHACPLSPQVELRLHLVRVHVWWRKLLKRKDVRTWAEEIGTTLRNLPIAACPMDDYGGRNG